MGGFHVEFIFLAIIGKRFKDAGLQDLVIESEILGPSFVESAFKGKAYNYACTSLYMRQCGVTSLTNLKKNVTYAEVLS